jgi:hypothetical protein
MSPDAEAVSDARTAIILRSLDRGTQVLLAIVKAAALVTLGYFAKEAILALVGQNTSVFVSFLTTTGSGLTATAGTAVGGLGAAYGFWQRRLHRRAIAHFGPRLRKYEKLLDPDRSTTGLTEFGQTNPDDE